MIKYDFEHHFYHPEVLKYLSTRTVAPKYDWDKQIIQTREGLSGAFAFPLNNPETTIMLDLQEFGENRIKMMDKVGIDVAVMSSSQAVEEFPREEAIKYARISNDAVATMMKRYPNRIMGAAILPTPFVDDAIAELKRCVNELGFCLWHTHSNYYKNGHLYEEKYLPLFEVAANLNCPFYVHPENPDDDDMKDMGYIYSAPGLGFGLDTMKTTLRIILNGTFDLFPNLKMIIGHFGEYYPFILDRLDNRFSMFTEPQIKAKHPISYYFKNHNVFVTTSGNMSKHAFECTKGTLGIDSIIFGSDYPYENFVDMTNFINGLDISEQERQKIYCDNAEKYLLNK